MRRATISGRRGLTDLMTYLGRREKTGRSRGGITDRCTTTASLAKSMTERPSLRPMSLEAHPLSPDSRLHVRSARIDGMAGAEINATLIMIGDGTRATSQPTGVEMASAT
jgi:hypothetical protein